MLHENIWLWLLVEEIGGYPRIIGVIGRDSMNMLTTPALLTDQDKADIAINK